MASATVQLLSILVTYVEALVLRVPLTFAPTVSLTARESATEVAMWMTATCVMGTERLAFSATEELLIVMGSAMVRVLSTPAMFVMETVQAAKMVFVMMVQSTATANVTAPPSTIHAMCAVEMVQLAQVAASVTAVSLAAMANATVEPIMTHAACVVVTAVRVVWLTWIVMANVVVVPSLIHVTYAVASVRHAQRTSVLMALWIVPESAMEVGRLTTAMCAVVMELLAFSVTGEPLIAMGSAMDLVLSTHVMCAMGMVQLAQQAFVPVALLIALESATVEPLPMNVACVMAVALCVKLTTVTKAAC